MRYHNITQDDMNNGDGLRVVLWVAGCEHHCKGCQNPVTWNPDDGLVFDKRAFNEIMKALEKYGSTPGIHGNRFLQTNICLQQSSMQTYWWMDALKKS